MGDDTLYTPYLKLDDEIITPKKLEIWADLKYEERTKGIYKIPVYTAFIDFNASFDQPFPHRFIILPKNTNNKSISVSAEGLTLLSGSIQLKGYGSFFASMNAKQNIYIQSNAKYPSFERILPNDYSIDKTGFKALYDFDGDTSKIGSDGRNLQIGFYQGVDEYRLIYRMIKYGYLFIALTFLVLFLCELALKKNIILLQYVILGVGLVVFYLMLLSFSEHIGFNLAYLFAALGVVIPISLYTLA